MKTATVVGIYCRLSREDNKGDISMSIANQRALLESYVEKEGWKVYRVYVDDGISGTTFDRPEFNQMILDIEEGKINCVITKDLSRLGRNYIETGRYTELFFPNHDVRYIAVNDGIDTVRDDNDIAPFKNILNEMYAKDISRKVRSTRRLMAEQGKFANSRAPYGYMKSAEDAHVLVVDENVAHNVVRIFELYLGGMTGRAIADIFNREGITPANEYFYSTINKPNPFRNNKNCWGSATIMNIIRNPVYYGAMASGKRAVMSFKNKRIVCKPAEDWIIAENTHEPLVSKDIWLEAQRRNSANKKDTVRRSANGEVSIFAGIIKCADCGGNMIFNRKVKKSGTEEFFRCGTYVQKGKNVCPTHKVPYETVYNAVLADIQQYAVLAAEDERKLMDRLLKSNDEYKNKSLSRYEKTIRESKNRIRVIDGLLKSLFEEKVAGNVSDTIFRRMTQQYEEEQNKLMTDVERMEAEYADYARAEQDLTGWIGRVKECLRIDTLTRAIAVELIDRIEVSEIYDKDGEKYLDMSIFYRFSLVRANQNPQHKSRAS